MPAYSAKDNALAVKLVTGFPENEKQGLPSFLSNVMVLDPKNGLLQAVSNYSFKNFVHCHNNVSYQWLIEFE